MKSLALKDIDARSLVSYIAILFIGVVVVGSTGIILNILNGTEGKHFGLHPYKGLIYFRSLIAAPLVSVAGLCLFHSKKNYIKVFVAEIKSMYF